MTALKPTHGLSVTHLTFTPHPLAETGKFMLENIPPDDASGFFRRAFYTDWLTMKRAEVIFENGWMLSIITMTPSDSYPIFHCDERIPTYEVAIFRPGGTMVGSPHYDVPTAGVDFIIRKTMSKPRRDIL